MATQVQLRRGNTSATGAFTGAIAEITVDTDKKTVVVHDGSTAGGTPLAKEVTLTSAYNHANAAFDKANQTAQLAFTTVSANGTSLVADANTDTLTITSNTANGIFINANASTDTLDIGLRTTGVTAGSYGNNRTTVTLTIDEHGRITAASQAQVDADPQGTAVALAIALG